MTDPVRVAIAGVGNCAASLVLSVGYYLEGGEDGAIMPLIDRLRPSDICFVAAFDVDRRKVRRPLWHAILADPNCTEQGRRSPVPSSGGPVVHMGPVLDGVAAHMAQHPEARAFRPAGLPPDDVVAVLRESRAEVLVNYMPVGAEDAARFYASCALEARCAFINAMPCAIATHPVLLEQFSAACLPLIGDDVKSQFGATYLHRALAQALSDRGCRVERTYQLNTGGNTDFLNMLDRSRLTTKRVSKTDAVVACLRDPPGPDNVHIGPSDYVPWQRDNKVAFIRVEAVGCGGLPIELECRLSVQDSPNSAGVVIDAIRFAAMALRNQVGGALTAPCAWLMKRPPVQIADQFARHACGIAAGGAVQALTLP